MRFIASLALLVCMSCGSQTDSKLSIYGGEKVVNTDEISKYTVVLAQNNRTVCTGALVAKEWVVTAAHCYFLVKQNAPLEIGFGLKVKDSIKVQAKGFLPHPGYDAAAGKLGSTEVLVNDVGLIKLSEPAPEGFEPVGILGSRESVSVGESVTLAGFGKNDASGGFASWFGGNAGELYQVETELVIEATKAKEIWVGNTPGKAACNGDSGGPALVARSGKLKLLGVTSRGRDCKSEVIYSDLRGFETWLKEAANRLDAM